MTSKWVDWHLWAWEMKLSSLWGVWCESFFPPLSCSDLSVSFSHCNLSVSQFMCDVRLSHGIFSSYFLFVSFTLDCVSWENITYLCVLKWFFFLHPWTWKNSLELFNFLDSLTLFLLIHVETHTWGTRENWVLIYKLATAPMTSKWDFFIISSQENFNFKMSWKLFGWELAA